MTDNTEVLTPIWVLKQKVENDWEEYKMLVGIDDIDEDDDHSPEAFPLYDSTFTCIEILEKYGIMWDRLDGGWNQ